MPATFVVVLESGFPLPGLLGVALLLLRSPVGKAAALAAATSAAAEGGGGGAVAGRGVVMWLGLLGEGVDDVWALVGR